jgi:hypothetical protein
MSTLYTDPHGYTRKRSKVEVAAAIEHISHRKIMIECGVLNTDIRVPPFQFIYRISQENGLMSIFDATNIYPRLVYEFYKNLQVVSLHNNTPCMETKVHSTTLLINVEVISEVTGILFIHAISTPFPNSVTPPPREELMACFDSSGEHEWEAHKNKISINCLQSPQRLLARIVLQNI